MIEVIRITGANLTDEVFSITLKTGEVVCWNVTKLNIAAKAGEFGTPSFARTADLPKARWTEWNEEDRATVDWIKKHPEVLDEPGIAIASEHPGYFVACFADGQHRVTARQELGLPEISFYVVPMSMERRFRVEGFPT